MCARLRYRTIYKTGQRLDATDQQLQHPPLVSSQFGLGSHLWVPRLPIAGVLDRHALNSIDDCGDDLQTQTDMAIAYDQMRYMLAPTGAPPISRPTTTGENGQARAYPLITNTACFHLRW